MTLFTTIRYDEAVEKKKKGKRRKLILLALLSPLNLFQSSIWSDFENFFLDIKMKIERMKLIAAQVSSSHKLYRRSAFDLKFKYPKITFS